MFRWFAPPSSARITRENSVDYDVFENSPTSSSMKQSRSNSNSTVSPTWIGEQAAQAAFNLVTITADSPRDEAVSVCICPSKPESPTETKSENTLQLPSRRTSFMQVLSGSSGNETIPGEIKSDDEDYEENPDNVADGLVPESPRIPTPQGRKSVMSGTVDLAAMDRDGYDYMELAVRSE
ncbi:unnamed protein product, partial [Cyprideis torosa]